jgi:hypothetical protein
VQASSVEHTRREVRHSLYSIGGKTPSARNLRPWPFRRKRDCKSVDLTGELIWIRTSILYDRLLIEACVVKWLTVVVLILAVLSSTVFARCGDAKQALNNRTSPLFSWLQIVTVAEDRHKSIHGHYGDLADLREGHLLDPLVFESDSSPSGQSKSAANYVPKSTVFQS